MMQRCIHPSSFPPLLKILLLSQVANGVWLAPVLVFVLLLVNRRDLMGEHVNSLGFNIVAWFISIVMIGITLFLGYATLFIPSAATTAGTLLL